MLLGLTVCFALRADDEVKINAMKANAALRSVMFAFGYKSLCAKPVEIDSKKVIPTSLDFLKSRQVPVVWADPANKSESQLVKAFFGTRMTCSSVTRDAEDKTRVRVQTQCVVSRREIADKSKPLNIGNTIDKVLWDAPSPEVLTTEKDALLQIQTQLNTLFEQFAAKYKNNEFKTAFAEAYYQLIK